MPHPLAHKMLPLRKFRSIVSSSDLMETETKLGEEIQPEGFPHEDVLAPVRLFWKCIMVVKDVFCGDMDVVSMFMCHCIWHISVHLSVLILAPTQTHNHLQPLLHVHCVVIVIYPGADNAGNYPWGLPWCDSGSVYFSVGSQ